MREGLALARKLDIGLWLPLYGTLVAEVETDAGLVEAGLATLDAQLLEVEQTEERWFVAEMHRVRGELLLKVQPPNVAAAESALLRAIEIARSQHARTFELRAALSLAKLYQTTDRNHAACELLVAALAGFSASPELPEVEEAQRLLTETVQRDGASPGLSATWWATTRKEHRA
jgi:predicted ATPase